MIQNFFVGYETKIDTFEIDNLELNNYNIIYNYLTTYFIIDLVSTIPFELLENVEFNTQNIKLIKFVKIIRLFRLIKVYPTFMGINYIFKNEYFSEISIFIKSNIGFLELLKVVCFLLIVTHFYTCLYFYYKTEILENYSLYWTYEYFSYDYKYKNSLEVYLKVYCEMLKTSLGLNSVKASETVEIFMDTMWIMLGLSIFGYGIGNISSYLSYANKRENELSETLKFFSELQEEHECEHLKTLIEYDIREYYNNYSINEFSKYSYMVSENIKTQIENSLYSSFIKLHPLFGLINIKSVKYLKQSKLKTDKYILRTNDLISSVYFVLKDSITVMNSNLCTINEYKTGEIFGMIHFKEYYLKKYNIDLENMLSIKKTNSETNKKNDLLKNFLNQKIAEKVNTDFQMIYNDIEIKCDYYAICSQEALYLEINYNILEEIIKIDVDSFKKIYKHSLKSLELISNKEKELSNQILDNFQNCNMYGFMIKQSGYFYDINNETRKKITELDNKYFDINCLNCLKKVVDEDFKDFERLNDINDLKIGHYIFEIDYSKYYFELVQIDSSKIARIDSDSAYFKLKKSLEDVKILYFKKC